MSTIIIPDSIRSARGEAQPDPMHQPLHEPPMNRWAPLAIFVTSIVLWGGLYWLGKAALSFAAAMGWL